MADSTKQKKPFGKKIEIKDQDKVTLRSFMGIKPPVYLGLLYGAALLLFLFFVLVYPGLSKPGSVGVFTSEPAGAAVRVDDITLGYTPCRVFIPQGKHSIEFVLPAFSTDRHDIDVKGRVFGSLFFPSKIDLAGKLNCPDPVGALALSAIEFMYWAAAGEPTEGFQTPLVLSEGVYRVGPAARDMRAHGAMQELLDACFRHAVTKVSLRDLLRSQFLLDNNGLCPTAVSALSSIKKMSTMLGGSSASPLWLAGLLPRNAAGVLEQSAWFAESPGPETGIGGSLLAFAPPPSLNLGAVSFVSAGAGSLEKYGFSILMPPMLVASSPVSKEAWDLFTQENPEWSLSNRESLVSLGLAGEDYLVTIEHPAFPENTAPGISWHAAKAYCSWLNAKLPASLDGWELKLPTENEWEYALRMAGLDSGLVWEWCSDPFAPLDFLPASRGSPEVLEKAENVSGSFPLERAVRGGSWINVPSSTGIESRGSLPPETSSPFVGFRPVIVPKQET